MTLFFSSKVSKAEVFDEIRHHLLSKKFTVINAETRPWGGFFVIAENQAEAFINEYFSMLNNDEITEGNKLSPKFLIVEAGKRLSWQLHYRRSELWKVVSNNVGVVRSDNDYENPLEVFTTNDLIKLKKGERHRLVGLDDWGVIAEIWQHTDKHHPSDEDDIVRLNDDFGR